MLAALLAGARPAATALDLDPGCSARREVGRRRLETGAPPPCPRLGHSASSRSLVPQMAAALADDRIVEAFHVFTRDALAQARAEGLLSDDDLETGGKLAC